MSHADDIRRQAAEWLVRRDRSDAPAAEQARFEAWLAADSRHRVAYLALERTWRESDALEAWRPRDGSLDAAVLRSRTARAAARSPRWLLAIAACAALVAVLASVIANLHAATYTTDVGGYQRVVLKDHSTVQLNTNSEIRVELAEHLRRVRLLRGEAFFEVAHDRKRPFEVVAGNTVVHAIGTAFTVRVRDPADVEVLVTEGRVTVRSDEAQPTRDSAHEAAPAAAISAGEGAIARPAGIAVHRIPDPEVARRLAWQEGELEFNGESLIQVIAEFNRYNRTRLEIADPKLAVLRVGGNFRATDLDAFIRALQASFPVRAQQSDGIIRLEARE
jgi:transmembrane sensor